MVEANCTVVGGHSIRDDDMKFGYAVTGVIDPRRVWRNVGAQPGDVLLLTKPIGTGVISTALKNGKASDESVAVAVAAMARLNKDAAEALLEVQEAKEIREVKEVKEVKDRKENSDSSTSSTSSTSFTSGSKASMPGLGSPIALR